MGTTALPFKLPKNDPERMVVELYFGLGRPQPEIARLLGTSTSRVNSLLQAWLRQGDREMSWWYPSHLKPAVRKPIPERMNKRIEASRGHFAQPSFYAPKADRNAEIVAARAAGETMASIAKRHGITPVRVGHIVMKAKRREGQGT
jgi:DNA-binding CsgD family transcriptional regulator